MAYVMNSGPLLASHVLFDEPGPIIGQSWNVCVKAEPLSASHGMRDDPRAIISRHSLCVMKLWPLSADHGLCVMNIAPLSAGNGLYCVPRAMVMTCLCETRAIISQSWCV